MDDDRTVQPIDLDATERIEAVAAATTPPVTDAAPPVPPSGVPDAPHLGAAAEFEQFEHPPTGEAADIERRATVHEAAQHGDPIAAAIERAHTADPTDRAQQLGGAAASAASGQGIPADPADVEEPRKPLGVDPRSPIDRLRNDLERPREQG